MTKIRITEKQYEVILSYKSLLKEGDDAIKTDLKVILAISVLIGLNITSHNKIMADMALKDKTIFTKIKETLESKDDLEELVKALEIKGLKKPEKKLKDVMGSLIVNSILYQMKMVLISNYHQLLW
jgi:hypothetical protein